MGLHPLITVTSHSPQLAPGAEIRERTIFTGNESVSLHSRGMRMCAVAVGKVV